MPTIFDVAKRAGVSIATVSRVLSQPDVVAPATRRKVMAAVERLGYAPNASAKNLRVRNTRGLIVTMPHITRLVWPLILLGIEDLANQEGYAVLLGDTRFDRGREERYARMLKERQADGLIFLGHQLVDDTSACVTRSVRDAWGALAGHQNLITTWRYSVRRQWKVRFGWNLQTLRLAWRSAKDDCAGMN